MCDKDQEDTTDETMTDTVSEDMVCPDCAAIMTERWSGISCNQCGYFDCL